MKKKLCVILTLILMITSFAGCGNESGETGQTVSSKDYVYKVTPLELERGVDGIKPFVYAVSGRQWDDIPRQANKLKEEHGDDFDAILIFMGTNDYNNAVPIGQWYEERLENVEYGHRYAKRTEQRIRFTSPPSRVRTISPVMLIRPDTMCPP